MERKIKHLIIASGLILSGAVAFLPLTSYAATSSESGTDISLSFTKPISIQAVAGAHIEGMPGHLLTGAFDVTVKSTTPYQIFLHADEPNLTDAEETYLIPARAVASDSTKVGWGVKLGTAANYSAITTSPELYFDSGSATGDITTSFDVGVMTNSKTPNGTYSTDVTVTVAVKTQ